MQLPEKIECTLLTPAGTDPTVGLTAQVTLADELHQRFGLTVQTRHDSRPLRSWSILLTTPNPAEPEMFGRLAESDVPRLPEHYRVCTANLPKDVVAVLQGNDARGLLYAVGSFLRDFLAEGMGYVREAVIADGPAFEVRGHVLANHHQTNTYEFWDLHQWEQYVRELALIGVNCLVTYPVHFARWPGIEPWAQTGPIGSKELLVEWERQWGIQRQIGMLAKKYGMRYGIWMAPNDVFPKQADRIPEMLQVSQLSRPYVCPSLPEAREAILDNRRRVFRELPVIDFLFVPSHDDGGCERCVAVKGPCLPWVRTYVSLVEETAAALHECHPEARIWLSNQGLPHDENSWLFHYLDRTRPPWLEALVYGPGSDELSDYMRLQTGAERGWVRYLQFGPTGRFLKEVRTHLPGEYQVILYPDISHPIRSQYPVRENNGGDAALWLLAGREDAPTYRAEDLSRIFRETARYAEGSAPYSEGNHDDFNKHVWSYLSWDPALEPDECRRRYAATYFGPRAAQGAAWLLKVCEETFRADFLLEQARDIDKASLVTRELSLAEPSLRQNWRWLMLEYTVLLLELVRHKQALNAEWLPRLYAALGAALNAKREGEARSILSDALESIRATQEARRTEELKARLVSLAERIWSLASIEIRSIRRLHYNLTELDWVITQLSSLGETSWQELTGRIGDILRYEFVRPGEAYIDAGYPIRVRGSVDVRLVRGMGCLLWGGSGSNRPSQNRYLYAPGALGVELDLTGLDDGTDYEIELTYVTDWPEPFEQRLRANGTEVHPPVEVPHLTPRRFKYELPAGCVQDGRLRLHFVSNGKYAMVSEIWIRRKEGGD